MKNLFHAMWLISFLVNATSSAIIMALANIQWENLDRQAKFLVVLVTLQSLSNVLMAFLYRAVNRKEGESFEEPPSTKTTP
jgi:hypothetical protein